MLAKLTHDLHFLHSCTFDMKKNNKQCQGMDFLFKLQLRHFLSYYQVPRRGDDFTLQKQN